MNDRDREPRGRRAPTDMSPAAIERRLEIMAQLWDTWQLLRTAERIGPVSDATVSEPEPDGRRAGREPR